MACLIGLMWCMNFMRQISYSLLARIYLSQSMVGAGTIGASRD
ncbi:hypothetical protein Z948_2621 [Sulfitobacter donghicola DSW-25 = KCTC 12864 = JCM 14565]|nr:hypothetical protein Z948_2621 [Sulfitobacter donghicola DSW-25 = KCTC 12864 = JCM 14565]